MPPPQTSHPVLDLSWDYAKQTLQEQKIFLKDLGPYCKLAAVDSNNPFLTRLRKLWFLRWPLKPARYLDLKGMRFREDQIWRDTKNRLMWAAFSSEVAPAHRERGWRNYLTICEARQGIYRDADMPDDKAVEKTNTLKVKTRGQKRQAEDDPAIDPECPSSSRPRPRPRPRQKKALKEEATRNERGTPATLER